MHNNSSDGAAQFAVALGIVWVFFALIAGIALTMMGPGSSHEGSARFYKALGGGTPGSSASVSDDGGVIKTKVLIQNADGSTPSSKETAVQTNVQIKPKK
jgi:hypothetical protein